MYPLLTLLHPHFAEFRPLLIPFLSHTFRYPYSAIGADKMLGRQYSNLASFKNGWRSSEYYKKRFDAPSNLTTVRYWRDTTNNASFYFDISNGSRHYQPEEPFLRALRLGPADVREFNGGSLYDISLPGGVIPNYYSDGTILNATVNATLGQQLYYYSHCELMPMLHRSLIAGLGKKESDVVQVEPKDFRWLLEITLGKAVLSIYNNTDDWLIRQVNMKEVYLVRNGYRFLVESRHLSALNLTFDDVVIVPVTEGLHFLPLSKTLFQG